MPRRTLFVAALSLGALVPMARLPGQPATSATAVKPDPRLERLKAEAMHSLETARTPVEWGSASGKSGIDR